MIWRDRSIIAWKIACGIVQPSLFRPDAPPFDDLRVDARGRSMLDRPEIAAKTFLHQGRVGNRYRPATIVVCYGDTAAGAGCRRANRALAGAGWKLDPDVSAGATAGRWPSS